MMTMMLHHRKCRRLVMVLVTVLVLGYLHSSTAVAVGPPDSIGTLADEKAAYTKWGWSWTSSQEPSLPPGPYYVGHLNPHQDLEADDLWIAILMWQRTGNSSYYEQATAWAD